MSRFKGILHGTYKNTRSAKLIKFLQKNKDMMYPAVYLAEKFNYLTAQSASAVCYQHSQVDSILEPGEKKTVRYFFIKEVSAEIQTSVKDKKSKNKNKKNTSNVK